MILITKNNHKGWISFYQKILSLLFYYIKKYNPIQPWHSYLSYIHTFNPIMNCAEGTTCDSILILELWWWHFHTMCQHNKLKDWIISTMLFKILQIPQFWIVVFVWFLQFLQKLEIVQILQTNAILHFKALIVYSRQMSAIIDNPRDRSLALSGIGHTHWL